VFNVFRHTSYYLAHPDLTLVYQRLIAIDPRQPGTLSHQVLGCGIQFALRNPDPAVLGKVFTQLTPAGQDLLRTWAWLFLWYNRIPVMKRQSILETLGMKASVQLLLPKGDS
jgi:hypothetical protein